MITKIYVGARTSVTLSGPAGVLDQTKIDNVVEISQASDSLLLVVHHHNHAEQNMMLFGTGMWGSVTWKQETA